MITFITGPMFAGKSTELLKKLKRSVLAGRKAILVRPHVDTRLHLTHDDEQLSHGVACITISNYQFDTTIDHILAHDTICIDEWQFFPPESWDNFIFPFLKKIQDLSRDCYIAGLSNSFQLRPFEVVSKLIPLANQIEVQTAICIKCGKIANYTSLRGADSTTDFVGSQDKYDAVCWACYCKSHPKI